MSQTAPPSDKTDKPAASPLVPPDERFWQRYSPHAEFPLSSAGSFVVHILIFGLLLLASFLGPRWFRPYRQVPIEAVQLSGGGGNRLGVGDASNTGEPREAGNQPENIPQETAAPQDVQPPPKIDVNPDTPSKPNFDDNSRRIQKTDEASNVFQSLNKRAMQIQSPGSKQSSGSGYGKGGTGSGGGSGSGTGTGTGSGSGEGTPLTQRQKRQLRWDIQFGYVDATDYVAQLKGLGAILALPVGEKGNDFDYRIVRDLSARPAKLLNEDPVEVLREINGMMPYFDKSPKNARDVFNVLRIPLPRMASDKLHFVALMPEKLEQRLSQLEKEYLHKHSPGRSEEDIESTTFRLQKVRNGRFELEVSAQKLQ
jgi:hypothetical protein